MCAYAVREDSSRDKGKFCPDRLIREGGGKCVNRRDYTRHSAPLVVLLILIAVGKFRGCGEEEMSGSMCVRV